MPTQSEISLNPTSTKGSILTSDGSSRSSLVVGTNGQILTAQSSASSGLEYTTVSTSGPAFERIASSSLTNGTTTQIIFSSIDTAIAYTSFRLVLQHRTTSTTAGAYAKIQFNSITTSTYYYAGWTAAGGLSTSSNNTDGFIISRGGLSSDANIFNGVVLEIFPKGNGMSTRNLQVLASLSGWGGDGTTANAAGETYFWIGKNTSMTSELSSITITGYNSTNAITAFKSGTRADLYGFRR